MTESAYKGLTVAENIFKAVVWDSVIKGALIYFHIDFWPVNAIICAITDYAFSGIRKVIDIEVIPFVNAAHKAAFDREAVKLKILAVDHGIDSEEFKNARAEARDDLSVYVSFGGR